jgi:hypothetical protein
MYIYVFQHCNTEIYVGYNGDIMGTVLVEFYGWFYNQ